MGAADGSVFTRQRVPVGLHQVSYLTGGRDGDMEPVLYLHGLGGGGKWESHHMALGTVTLTYAPLLPGFQEGSPPEGISSVGDYASLAMRFLDAVGIEKVILIGHSIGGWIALDLAVRFADRVSRMVLVDSMGLDSPQAPASDLGAISEEFFVKSVFAKVGLVARPQISGFGATWENVRNGPEFERQWRGRGLVAQLTNGSSGDQNLSNNVQNITQETRLVWGRSDGLIPPQHGEFLRKVMPHSSLDIIEGSGHLPMSEKPETFNRIMRDFLIGVQEDIPDVVSV